ncbi:MAG TPA: cyclic nucleotide-binding domain-containing protein [Caulobacteraceae bacterium]|nr:cyclic nucleotide-binding domain-containing protein [Caulobacteraceae bacterium]
MSIRATDLGRIQALPLFAGAAPETVAALTAGAYLQKLPAHTTLILEGDDTDALYVLVDGAVELVGTWNDKETSVAVLRPVSAFILAAVVVDAEALLSAETLERSEVLMIPAEAVRRAMAADGAFCLAVAREMALGYRGLVRAFKNQKLRGGVERLANYLVSERARQGGGRALTLAHEKRVLASLLGMTPENLSRAFSTLADYGVEVHGAEVVITRPEPLARLAKPTPLIDPPAENAAA